MTAGPGELLGKPSSWDDLTLPLAELTELNQLSARLLATRSKAPGLRYGPNIWSASQFLFHGSSSNGKILAAQLIARDLGLSVRKIPSAALVKRYIGETEKNLDRVFERAAGQAWILFFDEADALFGKRTGVRSHHSRYANQEVSYLLERAERYRGVVILSTQVTPRFASRLMRRFEAVVAFS